MKGVPHDPQAHRRTPPPPRWSALLRSLRAQPMPPGAATAGMAIPTTATRAYTYEPGYFVYKPHLRLTRATFHRLEARGAGRTTATTTDR